MIKLTFQYRDESPYLMPGYSRYTEVIGLDNVKHVGMIHLAHSDYRMPDGTMPPYLEVTITPKLASEVENDKQSRQSDVSRSKSVAKGPEAKPETRKASARTRATDARTPSPSELRGQGSRTSRKSKSRTRPSKKGR